MPVNDGPAKRKAPPKRGRVSAGNIEARAAATALCDDRGAMIYAVAGRAQALVEAVG
jgi:hypothetical protein